MPPLIRPAGHLLPARGEKETRSDLPARHGINAGQFLLLLAAGERVGVRRNVFHLRCALRPVDKNRQKR
ncbi:hypothetical protein ELH93_14340 [Rhizobium leguminosarum]|nr:hypothetical protein ELI40_15620 [Rhizobium leguminosarum]TAV90416.1 hypothetical protein ELI22_14820 [Rhizobium leguminosarum]TAV95022.1 hypothetical protein ELI21_14980 [Rhizobium leguminosarum]TAW36099.1 hypothetical protein ELI23_15020 [Rhizobium leguminosarum]TAX10718.1 hypothetical protein ELI07_15020 [Rhizobium leguminosarum]